MRVAGTICNYTIRQDSHGRYNLNDLHRAAGGQDKDRPGYFLARPDTGGLIGELLIESRQGIDPVHSVAGRYGGTHAVREIVYAYAMWISPRFHLQVIRGYDAMRTAVPVPVAAPETPELFFARALLLAQDTITGLQVLTKGLMPTEKDT